MQTKEEKSRIREALLLLGLLVLLFVRADAQTVQCQSLFVVTVPLGKYLDQGTRSGYIDCKGNVVADLKYEAIFEFQDGRGVLIDGKDSLVVELNGLTQRLNNTLVLTPFSEGRAIASRNGRVVVIGGDGNATAELPDRFRPGSELVVGGFDSGLAIVYLDRVGENVGFIDLSGRQAIQPRYDYSNGFSGGLATVEVAGKFGVINRLGEYVVAPTDLQVLEPLDGTVGFETARNTWRFVDVSGKVILDNLNFENLGAMSDGMIAVSNGDHWGFINAKGEEAIPIRYDDAGDFSCGLAAVRIGKRWGFVDKTGTLAIGMRFDEVFKPFKNGLAYVATRSFEGYINAKGNWIWKRRR